MRNEQADTAGKVAISCKVIAKCFQTCDILPEASRLCLLVAVSLLCSLQLLDVRLRLSNLSSPTEDVLGISGVYF